MLCADIINRRLTDRGRRRMTSKQYYFIPIFSRYRQAKDILGNHCSAFSSDHFQIYGVAYKNLA